MPTVAPLLNADVEKMDDMIALNITTLTRLTYAAAPAFVARERGNVESDHVVHLLNVGIQQRRDGADASIVDEHGDGLIIPQRGFHLREIPLVIEVRWQRSDRAS